MIRTFTATDEALQTATGLIFISLEILYLLRMFYGRSRWPAAARFLGLQVRISRETGMSSVACCQAEVSATGRSLVQGSPKECGVSECYREVRPH